VLEVDATMMQHPQEANAALRKNYSLDAEHKPHISVMGGYFSTANLEKTYAAIEKVLATEKVLNWKMKAVSTAQYGSRSSNPRRSEPSIWISSPK
jgi:hypothetical protein